MNTKTNFTIVITLILSLLSCTFYLPNFTVIDNCLIKDNRAFFKSITIVIADPDKPDSVDAYVISRDYDFEGSTRICLENIPIGYEIHVGGYNTSLKKIILEEAKIVTISSSGGDRGSYTAKFIVKNGKLKPYRRMKR